MSVDGYAYGDDVMKRKSTVFNGFAEHLSRLEPRLIFKKVTIETVPPKIFSSNV